MINCYKSIGEDTVNITSRSKLDATGKFHSLKSFRELFIEAYLNTIGSNNYNELEFQEYSKILNGPDSENNEYSTFFSFLVQHKENRIVTPITDNRVYTVHRGVVYNDGSVLLEDTPNIEGLLSISEIIVNENITKSSYAEIASSEQNEVQRYIKRLLYEKDWKFQGLVFKDNLGNRWRFRSEKYSGIKTLRGNTPNVFERFAQLYTQNLIPKYLEYYSEESMSVIVYVMLMESIVKLLYDNYVDLHIKKVVKVEQLNKMFLPHLYNIHGIYLSHLKPNNKKINFNEIKMYLHKLPWQRIVFLMKKTIDYFNESNTNTNTNIFNNS
jgi:hypothetical protein